MPNNSTITSAISSNTVGLLPCAGFGERFPLPFSKELLPARLEDAIRPICECAIHRMIEAGVTKIVVVARVGKMDVIRHIATEFERTCRFAYVMQNDFPATGKSRGLLQAIQCALPWTDGNNVIMALPDTIFGPIGCLSDLLAELNKRGDAIFGVFPTEHPEQLAPVVSGPDNHILEIWDKPGTHSVKNTWGCIAWRPAFSAYIQSQAAIQPGLDFPTLLQQLLSSGMQLFQHEVREGYFRDVGEPHSWLGSLDAAMPDGLVDRRR